LEDLAVHPVFSATHYAATMPRKLQRSLALGPKYYLNYVPRYWLERSRRKPSAGSFDWEVLWSPLQEFGFLHREPHVLPPGVGIALDKINAAGLKISLPPERFLAICSQWGRVARKPGTVIECGSYRGTTGLALALLGAQIGAPQDIHMFDLFGMRAGLEFQSVDGERQDNEFIVEADFAAKLGAIASTLGVADQITIHQGLFEKTFPEYSTGAKLCKFAHVDANVYSSTKQACQFLASVLEEDAVVVFDDYHGVTDLGARLAIDQTFCLQQGKPRRLRGTSAVMTYKKRA
jgi:Methyltransferase domain